MELIMLTVIVIMLVIVTVLIFVYRPKNETISINHKLQEVFSKLDKISGDLREEFRINREESSNASRDNRKELAESLTVFKSEMNGTLRLITEQNHIALEQIHKILDEKIRTLIDRVDENNRINRESITGNLKDFSLDQRNKLDEMKKEQKDQSASALEQLDKITKAVQERITAMIEQSKADNNLSRQTIENAFQGFNKTFKECVAEMNNIQREKFGQLEEKQLKLVESTEKKLEQVRETVDEKLQKTLNERLGQSFELVGRQLESVQKGLGEMQTLAQDVGGLKRVLSNVKMRGGFGEVQLSMLLENILAPDQYESNVKLKDSSTEVVEFAIKMPNKEGDRNFVWLAIDAKFPRDAYEYLQNAYDTNDVIQIEEAQKNLEVTIRKMAKDICDKYINPPNTTDFAIMFLPFEGIYAEVVRKASLLEDIQKQCKVVVTGPTTLAAILNSLQMGFRTLAIQKRSSEVWNILGAVKKEFESFGGMLEKAQKNIQTASNQIDEVMGKRTRAIQRKLKDVEVLGEDESQVLLSDLTTKELLDEEE
jgi:DNA recombination protein RmuC